MPQLCCEEEHLVSGQLFYFFQRRYGRSGFGLEYYPVNVIAAATESLAVSGAVYGSDRCGEGHQGHCVLAHHI